MRNKSILEMTPSEARKFFMKPTNYVTFNFPDYYDFRSVLEKAEEILKQNEFDDLLTSKKSLSEMDNVNCTIHTNKDGNYAWRPKTLIHPIVYVDLIKTITLNENWNKIKSQLSKFQSTVNIECISLPLESNYLMSDKAESIYHWWKEFEQRQIELSMDYSYCIVTDIMDCYSSMYTHTIPWAIHGKEWAKKNRKPNFGIGNKIDTKIQHMQNGQTNGIPQGSLIMDLLAEIILGYADSLLADSIGKYTDIKEYDYKILRFRDDYRIFSSKKDIALKITKLLSDVLSGLNLKLNPHKTRLTEEIIINSIKADKIYWDMIYSSIKYYMKSEDGKVTIDFKVGIQKHLLQIKILADKYPNSGSVLRALTDIYKFRIYYITSTPYDLNQIISIVIDIMIKNPNAIEHCIVLLSKLISFYDSDYSLIVIDKIIKKYHHVPNVDYAEIWLQRLSLEFMRDKEYESNLCKKVINPDKVNVWNSKWIKDGFDESTLINLDKLANINLVIPIKEIDMFIANNTYY